MTSQSQTPQAALHGIVIVDFSELLPGPLMTQMLVDMGARVVKVERPPKGDPVRESAPGLFAAVNRGKESVQIDLKSDEGLSHALALVKQADILVESYRPGTLERLGLGYERLKEINPGLIYVSLSGYGQFGPDAMRPGHDLNYLAAAGAVALTAGSSAATNPQAALAFVPSGQSALPYADVGGSLYGLSAVLAALFQRQSSGQGQWLDVSLTEAILHQMTVRLAVFQQHGLTTVQEQRAFLERPAYGCFECADGQFITLGALETHFFSRLIQTLQMSEFSEQKWLDSGYRKTHATHINQALAQQFLQMNSKQVIDMLNESDVPVMPVVLPGELEKHPQHVARQAFEPSVYGMLPRFPVRLSGMCPSV